MRERAQINKAAWEYRAYEFWNQQASPSEKAAYLKKDPKARLRYHQKYFENISGLKIANPCGSNGRIAVPLALLGADVTVFDISEENRRYALELAKEAGVAIRYVVGDFCEIDPARFGDSFDIVYAEGGVLHYFSDLDAFTMALHVITKRGGQLILSDFHPFRKVNPSGSPMMSVYQMTGGDYFDSQIHSGDVAYQRFFSPEEQKLFPKCSLRYYTIGEIVSAVARAGFTIREFIEHPNFDDKKLPGEFTIVASK
ncbi:MAG: class I SAM-dependent methyltransferase [Eubacteriales bacterium]|nr:class I SAM-dependent methyltransferase [Eubacteriales bacterium]